MARAGLDVVAASALAPGWQPIEGLTWIVGIYSCKEWRRLPASNLPCVVQKTGRHGPNALKRKIARQFTVFRNPLGPWITPFVFYFLLQTISLGYRRIFLNVKLKSAFGRQVGKCRKVSGKEHR
jgi:hypothetical protein